MFGKLDTLKAVLAMLRRCNDINLARSYIENAIAGERERIDQEVKIMEASLASIDRYVEAG